MAKVRRRATSCANSLFSIFVAVEAATNSFCMILFLQNRHHNSKHSVFRARTQRESELSNPLNTPASMCELAKFWSLQSRTDIQNIPVLDNVFFAFQAQFAMLARLCHAAQRHQVRIGNRF